mmetsp:Transcript_6972/g.12509  ORF Transcript_6972/g.12509 Transcript_6972/m.12509 type:complete len:211 (-) Transcript_6972:214-846(-)
MGFQLNSNTQVSRKAHCNGINFQARMRSQCVGEFASSCESPSHCWESEDRAVCPKKVECVLQFCPYLSPLLREDLDTYSRFLLANHSLSPSWGTHRSWVCNSIEIKPEGSNHRRPRNFPPDGELQKLIIHLAGQGYGTLPGQLGARNHPPSGVPKIHSMYKYEERLPASKTSRECFNGPSHCQIPAKIPRSHVHFDSRVIYMTLCPLNQN